MCRGMSACVRACRWVCVGTQPFLRAAQRDHQRPTIPLGVQPHKRTARGPRPRSAGAGVAGASGRTRQRVGGSSAEGYRTCNRVKNVWEARKRACQPIRQSFHGCTNSQPATHQKAQRKYARTSRCSRPAIRLPLTKEKNTIPGGIVGTRHQAKMRRAHGLVWRGHPSDGKDAGGLSLGRVPFRGLLRAQLFSGCEWTSARSSNGLAIAASAWPSKDDAWRRTLRCVDRPGAVIHKREAPSHPDHRTGRRRPPSPPPSPLLAPLSQRPPPKSVSRFCLPPAGVLATAGSCLLLRGAMSWVPSRVVRVCASLRATASSTACYGGRTMS